MNEPVSLMLIFETLGIILLVTVIGIVLVKNKKLDK